MKNRIILTMILAVTAVSGLLAGCGAKNASAKEISAAKAEKLSIADNTSKKDESITDILTVRVLADHGWDADSTPAILHIEEKEADGLDFYHAISPDAEGGKGSASIKLPEGDYTVEFVSPLNNDGSAYEIDDMGSAQEIIVGIDNKDLTLDCEMKQIPAEQVSDEMIREIVKATQTAMEKGDDTLKGDVGKAVLAKLAANIQDSPNASEETKRMAASETNEMEVKPEASGTENKENNTNNVQKIENNNIPQNTNAAVENNNTVQNNASVNNNNDQNNASIQNNSQNNNIAIQPSIPVPAPSQPSAPVESKPQTPAHIHTWADHVVTSQEWVANVVTVPDYEEQTFAYWNCNCGEVIPLGVLGALDDSKYERHAENHVLNDEPANGFDSVQTTLIQIGSHTEDQGHYETKTTVDYIYCTGCGARQ